jgi:hypothetical protein
MPRIRTEAQKARDRERQKARYAAKREEILVGQKRQRDANREEIRQRDRARQHVAREVIIAGNFQRRHSLWADEWASLWAAQDGRCYLCGEEMIREKARVDHDHSCCPRDRSCPACRRGLCHDACNKSIGLAGDDPDRLEHMAAALRVAKAAAAARIAALPEQLALDA